jgi:hypothetical protein
MHLLLKSKILYLTIFYVVVDDEVHRCFEKKKERLVLEVLTCLEKTLINAK